MARNRIASKSIEDGKIVFTFSNDTVREVNVNDLPENITSHAVEHGLSQKLGDSYAGAESVEAAIEAFDATFEALANGNWNAGRSGGGGGPRVSQLSRALVRYKESKGEEMSQEDAVEVISGLEDDQKKALREALKPHIEAIRLEDQKAKAEAAAGAEVGDVSDILGS